MAFSKMCPLLTKYSVITEQKPFTQIKYLKKPAQMQSQARLKNNFTT
jgi:hypothetical protein